jgi:hypothetical protein
VIGYVTTTVNPVIGRPDFFKKTGIDKQIVFSTAFPKCINMGMFAKKQISGKGSLILSMPADLQFFC